MIGNRFTVATPEEKEVPSPSNRFTINKIPETTSNVVPKESTFARRVAAKYNVPETTIGKVKPQAQPQPEKEEGLLSKAGKYVLQTNPFIPGNLFDRAKTQVLQPVVDKTLNIPVVQDAMKAVAERTSGTGVVSMIQSAGPEKTFKEAYDANREAQAGNTSKLDQFMTQLGDSVPQTAIGVALNFVPYAGKPLSTAYWTALSANEQIESKGKVESLNPILIDVVGDRMLGNSIEAMFKTPSKTLLQTVSRSFVTEGGTEVAQDLLKYQDAYLRAKTSEERAEILAEAKQYFTSGQILMTLGVGGISGAGVGTAAYTVNQSKKLYEGMTPEERQAGFAKVPGIPGETPKEFLYRGQPSEFKNVQQIAQSDAIDNILIGRGIFTTTDENIAKTYGENIFKFEKPKGKIFDLTSASESDLRKILPNSFFEERRLGGLIHRPDDTFVSTYKTYKDTIKKGDIRDAEDMLFESMADKYLPENVTWEEVKGGATAVSGKGPLVDLVRDNLLTDLTNNGFEWMKHQGGIRAGDKEHDVYIALKDEALKQVKDVLPTKTQPKSLFPSKAEPQADQQKEPIGETPADTVQGILDLQNLRPDQAEMIEPLEKVMEDEKRTSPVMKVGWFDILRTPWRVMKRLGVYKEYRALIGSYEKYILELPKNMQKISSWASQVSKEGNQRIFQFLDGKKVDLNPQETKIAGEVRTWLEQWADRLGMEQDDRITDYITHIFPMGKKGEIPEEIARLIHNKPAKSIYNPFQLQRQGAEGYIEDTWAALEAYVKRATRKANIDPALQEFNEATVNLNEVSQAEYIEKRISALNMRPTNKEMQLDNNIHRIFPNIGPRPTLRITTAIRKMISGSKIGGSVVTFAKNLTQGVNTWSELGSKYTMRGYTDLVKFGDKELVENSVLRDSFYEDKKYSAIKDWAEKFNKKLFINMEASELVNRGGAYYGAKAKFLAGKITAKEFDLAFGTKQPENYVPTEKEAIQYGKFIAEKTQFLFGPLETPQIMSGPMAKTAFQFQTFALKQTEFVGQLASDREIAKLSRYLFGSALLFKYIGGVFGMRWDESFKTWRWGLPPVIQFVQDLWDSGVLGEDKYGNELDWGERAGAVGKSLFTNVVPMGAQLKRSYEGLKAVSEGASRTKSGNLQYKIEKTPMNYIRGTLFGKGNLPSAREYYDNRDKGVTKSSSTRTRF